MSLSGHIRTVAGVVVRNLSRTPLPDSVPWSRSFEDPVRGAVRITGLLSGPSAGLLNGPSAGLLGGASAAEGQRHAAAGTLLILVHGLGGSSDSVYMREMASAAVSLGLSCLRLNLRGADHQGRDFYHGGLTDDLHAAVTEPSLSRFERLVVLGFSLGGHIVLRFATEVEEPRVTAVAGVCSPLDLGVGARAIDSAALGIYRFYLLRGLKAMHRSLARAGELRGEAEAARRARTLRQWDGATVVPRFGFADVDDYYRRASVGSGIRDLRRPALILATRDDPMVPVAAIRDFIAPEPIERLTLRWFHGGGHLALPRRIDLGLDGAKDWRSQVVSWLLTRGIAPDDKIPRGESE